MRIVGGAWRGRALAVPAGRATRPTADRVRQALFDMLLHAPWGGRDVLEGAAVLDAFAGTGALGLEALSRGAAQAAFIERDAAALAALRANVAACRAEARARVIAGDALRPPRAAGACAVVFLDPPYLVRHPRPPHSRGQGCGEPSLDFGSFSMGSRFRGNDEVGMAFAALTRAGWLGPDTLIVAETARESPALVAEPLAERVHGAARITVWRAGSEMAPAGG